MAKSLKPVKIALAKKIIDRATILEIVIGISVGITVSQMVNPIDT